MPHQKIIGASESKAKCLKLVDEVADSGEKLIIAKNRKPATKLVSCINHRPVFCGADKDRIEALGDIVSRIDINRNVQAEQL